MKKYKKAPAFMGKVLTLFVAGGDRRIGDTEVLEGGYWQKFVEQGFLVPCAEEQPKAPAPAPAPVKVAPVPKPDVKPEPEPAPEPEPQIEKGTATKSSASKMAKLMGKKSKSATKKKEKK